jgi:hypothetical protein
VKMRTKIVSIFCALALLSIPSSAYSASDTAADEVAYLHSAETAILQAQAFDNDPELAEALRAIRSVEVAYLRSAETAILQAQAFDNDPGLVEALRAIRSVEASFVKVAGHSLKEAFAISPRAETKAALDEIAKIEKSLLLDSSQALSGSIKTGQGNADEANRARSVAESVRLDGAVPQKHRPAQEVSWLDTLLSVLAALIHGT